MRQRTPLVVALLLVVGGLAGLLAFSAGAEGIDEGYLTAEERARVYDGCENVRFCWSAGVPSEVGDDSILEFANGILDENVSIHPHLADAAVANETIGKDTPPERAFASLEEPLSYGSEARLNVTIPHDTEEVYVWSATDDQEREGLWVLWDSIPPEIEVTRVGPSVPYESGDEDEGEVSVDTIVSPETTFWINATDGGSGLASLDIRVNWDERTSPFQLTRAGVHEIEIEAEDEYVLQGPRPHWPSGTSTAWQNHQVLVDTESPTLTVEEPASSERFGNRSASQAADNASMACRSVLAPQICALAPIAEPYGLNESWQYPCREVFSPLVCETTGSAIEDAVEATYRATPDILVGRGETTFEVNASDPLQSETRIAAGVDRVEFHVDGERRHVDTERPYTWAWDTSEDDVGEHTVEIVAVDRVDHRTVETKQAYVAPAAPAPG